MGSFSEPCGRYHDARVPLIVKQLENISCWRSVWFDPECIWQTTEALCLNVQMSTVRNCSPHSPPLGCVLLTDGKPLDITLPLHSPQMPVLCLLDEMYHRGFKAHDGIVHHGPGSPLVFDARDAASKRFYCQVLLCQDELWAAGVVSAAPDKIPLEHKRFHVFKHVRAGNTNMRGQRDLY